MIWHLIITPIVALLNSLYAALPVWNIDIGQSWLVPSLEWLASLDRFMPLHDALLPALSISGAVFVALFAFKLIKFILSLVPTISAGG